jgi:GDP-4-dehydro-6-deoxy-D-mannose reductase
MARSSTPCPSSRPPDRARYRHGAAALRALITGASGFAGAWLVRACVAAGDSVAALSRTGAVADGAADGLSVDLRDTDAVRAAVRDTGPEVVYHLAALSSVARSWEDPTSTVQENVATAVSLLEAIRRESPSARVVWVSTCEVYGKPASLPLHEDAPLQPANPYAVSKATGDMLAAVYADAHGLDIVRARPFSHAGPGQRPIFIVSSLARQAAQARISGQEHMRIVTGNPDARRDFTDVRDVVRAYRRLAEAGRPGVYNVSSGHSVSAAEQVALLGELIAPLRVEHEIDPARVRAHEVMDLRGDHQRLTAATGWEPEISFRQTMADTIRWWEQELSGAPADDTI